MSDPALNKDFTRTVRDARMRFLKELDPLRPELHRFCRSLTGNPWDAEDLLQDVLLKAFAKLGEVHWSIENPRAWLFRVATNHWIDRTRRPQEAALAEEHEMAARRETPPNETREALARLACTLPPRERACVLLKDVFDFSLQEAASWLGATTGAVKAALHRGREKLAQTCEPEAPRARADVSAELLDRWCEAFNAGDLDGLASLFAEDADAEVVGMVQEYGRRQIRDGSLEHTLRDPQGKPFAERVELWGEPLVLLWYEVEEDEGRARYVRDILRFREGDRGLASLRYYYFCPETLAEAAKALGVPLRDNGYRYG